MIASVAESTMKQYLGPIKDWCIYCAAKNLNVYVFRDVDLVDFLMEKYNAGCSYGSLNSTRSAISFIAERNLSTSETLNRFFKGVYKCRPAKPKYDRIWDPSLVLDYLSKLFPLSSLKMSVLTEKVVTLLALGTGHRIQTLSFIKISNIKKVTDGLEIEIPDLIKTSKAGAYQPLLRLPYFSEKPELCLANTVLEYVKLTKSVRGSCDNLIITCKKPYNAASTQTISRWIKSVLSRCGVGEEYSAYSTRHASTSLAYKKGVNIQIIKSTAGWSKSSEVFTKFYNRPIASPADVFAKSVIE